jgi:predicted RNA-binding Zn ribbon-like protein
MALTISQKQARIMSHRCANVLVNFVNANSSIDAISGLDESFRKSFNVKIIDAQREFKYRKKYIKEAQQRLINFIDELKIDRTLQNSATIANYNLDYHRFCHCQVMPDARFQNDSNVLAFLETKANNPFEAVLAFLVFQYIKDETRKPILKCNLPQCRLYFVAKRNTAKFCSTKHKMCQFRIFKSLMNLNSENQPSVQLSTVPKPSTKKIKPSSSIASPI